MLFAWGESTISRTHEGWRQAKRSVWISDEVSIQLVSGLTNRMVFALCSLRKSCFQFSKDDHKQQHGFGGGSSVVLCGFHRNVDLMSCSTGFFLKNPCCNGQWSVLTWPCSLHARRLQPGFGHIGQIIMSSACLTTCHSVRCKNCLMTCHSVRASCLARWTNALGLGPTQQGRPMWSCSVESCVFSLAWTCSLDSIPHVSV
jgi:hypothetical protein